MNDIYEMTNGITFDFKDLYCHNESSGFGEVIKGKRWPTMNEKIKSIVKNNIQELSTISKAKKNIDGLVEKIKKWFVAGR